MGYCTIHTYRELNDGFDISRKSIVSFREKTDGNKAVAEVHGIGAKC